MEFYQTQKTRRLAPDFCFIHEPRPLNFSEKLHNGRLLFRILTNSYNGFTREAAAAVVANAELESDINPGRWEGDNTQHRGGLGFWQFTPASKYTVWAESNGYGHYDGYGQIDWLNTQTAPYGQWCGPYRMSFLEFKKSHMNPEQLSIIFLRNFERPANQGKAVQNARAAKAREWFDRANAENWTPAEKLETVDDPAPGFKPTPEIRFPDWFIDTLHKQLKERYPDE